MFEHILIATDLSPRSDEAMHIAVTMAATHGAKLTVLNVQEEFMDKDEMVMLRVSVDQMQEKFKKIALNAKKKMSVRVKAEGFDNLDVKYLLHEGDPAEVIIKNANALAKGKPTGSVLTIMGTNGRDSIKDLILGTVAEHVVRNSQHPIMVIPSISE